MSLDEVVNVQITRETSTLTLPGFGTPMILGQHTRFVERLRYYTKAADMLDDGFLTGDAIYQQALIAFSQRPRPTRVAIGRRAAPVAQTQIIVTPAAPGSTTLYRFAFNGFNIDYTTDGSATQAELRDGLILFFNNINLNPWASVAVASASGNNILITSSSAGIGFTVAIDAAPASNPLLLGAQTQLFTTPAAPNSSVLYRLLINGENCDYTTDASATQAELRDNMIVAINNKVGAAVTASASGTDVLVTGDVGGVPFTFAIDAAPVTNPFTLGAATGLVANSGIAEDIAAVQAEQADWYGLLIPERSAELIMKAAAAIEGFGAAKLFMPQTGDAIVIGDTFSGSAANTPATDVGTRLKNLGYARTAPWYHANSAEYLDAGIEASCLARVPGSYTAKFKEVAGVTPDTLTATQRANLRAKNVNFYEPFADRAITAEGVVSVGEFIDIIHGIDKLQTTIQINVANSLLKNAKVPYTTSGLAVLASNVYAALLESTSDGLIADSRTLADGTVESPAFTVRPPAIEDIPAADKAARAITASHPIVFEGTLAGAIHALVVTGTLSV